MSSGIRTLWPLRPSPLPLTKRNYYHNCPVTFPERGCGSRARNFQPGDGWMVQAPRLPSCSCIQTIPHCVTLNAVPSECSLINGHEIWASSLSIEPVHPSDTSTAFLSSAFLTQPKALKAQWLQCLTSFMSFSMFLIRKLYLFNKKTICLVIFEGNMLSDMLISGVRCDSMIILDKIRQIRFNGGEQNVFFFFLLTRKFA